MLLVVAGQILLVVMATLEQSAFLFVSGFYFRQRRLPCKAIEVDANASSGMSAADRRRDLRAPVPALGSPAIGLTQTLHEFNPRTRNAAQTPAGLLWLTGEAIAGQRGYHQVKRVCSIAAKRDWVAQCSGNLVKFDD